MNSYLRDFDGSFIYLKKMQCESIYEDVCILACVYDVHKKTYFNAF